MQLYTRQFPPPACYASLHSGSGGEVWLYAADIVAQKWRELGRTVEAALRQSKPSIDRAERGKDS